MLRFIHLQPRSLRAKSKHPLASSCSSATEQKCLARINHSTVLGTSKSQHLWGSGYVVLLLLTGLPPFIIADALVLLLGVTPAFGTVSPTSCKDGSRYMATRNRKEGMKKGGNEMLPSSVPESVHTQTSAVCPVLFPWSKAIPLSSCSKAVISCPQTEDITSFTLSGLYDYNIYCCEWMFF